MASAAERVSMEARALAVGKHQRIHVLKRSERASVLVDAPMGIGKSRIRSRYEGRQLRSVATQDRFRLSPTLP
jgi:hypothetical protein